MNKHEYICKITDIVASKATCNRALVGAVFINNEFEILATGFNGSPRKFDHCDDVGHNIVDGHCINTIHAEQNAIVQAAKRGVVLRNSILYVTHLPCLICIKLLINLQINKIYYKKMYGDAAVLNLFNKANITVLQWEQ